MSLRATVVVLVASLGAACGSSMPTRPTPLPDQPPAPIVAPAPVPAPEPEPAPAKARYRVDFTSTWSAATHPTDFPSSAHYSGLIGGTHTAGVTFWREGGFASEGIRRMAERGSKTPLDSEVAQAIAAGSAEFVLSGPALNVSPGSTSMEFEISQSFPLVTLVTMIAPSPDWFAGVASLPLFVDGQWLDAVTVELYGMDAGTDSGRTYSAADDETVPRQPITRLSGYPVANGGIVAPFGTFTFVRIE